MFFKKLEKLDIFFNKKGNFIIILETKKNEAQASLKRPWRRIKKNEFFELQ